MLLLRNFSRLKILTQRRHFMATVLTHESTTLTSPTRGICMLSKWSAGVTSTFFEQSLLWWLIAYVNLTESQGAQICSQTLSWMFLHKNNIYIGRLSKVDVPLECGWPSSNQLMTWIERKRAILPQGRDFFFCLQIQTETFALPSSQTFKVRLEVHYQPSWASSLLTSTTAPWDLPASITARVNSL